MSRQDTTTKLQPFCSTKRCHATRAEARAALAAHAAGGGAGRLHVIACPVCTEGNGQPVFHTGHRDRGDYSRGPRTARVRAERYGRRHQSRPAHRRRNDTGDAWDTEGTWARRAA